MGTRPGKIMMMCAVPGCEMDAEFVTVDSITSVVCEYHLEWVVRAWRPAGFMPLSEWYQLCPPEKFHAPHVGCWMAAQVKGTS